MTVHEALRIATSPAWSEPSEEDSTGVDFLGTRQVNLDMLTKLTGAYNNQVTSARQHAIMCWAAWRYRENCRAAGTEPTNKQFRDFADAVETIQLAGQRAVGPSVGGTSGGLGSGSLPQLGDGPTILLRFKQYGRSHANTSAFAPVLYGPSAKLGSFGFMDLRAGIWAPTARGVLLAEALDPLLRRSTHYDEISQLPAPDAMDLATAIAIAREGVVIGAAIPDRPEREPYVEALFDLDGMASSHEHERKLSLALLLELVRNLEDSGSVAAADVRLAMLSGRKPNTDRLTVSPYLESNRAGWQLLQLRQLQRYMLEAWLYVVECCMLAAPGSPRQFVDTIADVLSGVAEPDDDLGNLLDGRTGDAVARFLAHRKVDDVFTWACTGEASTPWAYQWDTEESIAEGGFARVLPLVVGLTLSVLALSQDLVRTDDPTGFSVMGRRDRISLLHFRSWWEHRAATSVRDALREMLEELVLQQHVAVAVARFDNKQRRLRFCNDEQGWELLPGSEPAVPSLTPDRIWALLQLMSDLGLVEVDEAGFQLADPGRKLLGRLATTWT